MALAAVLLAIVVIGALIAGIFFASSQEYQLGRNALLQTRAFANAEEGLNDVYARWDNADNVRLGTGESRTFTTPTARVTVTRTTPATFWAVSEGWVAQGSVTEASRRTGMLWSLDVPALPALAALTIRGPIVVGDAASIDGTDTPVAGWNCGAPAPALAGIMVDDLADVTTEGAPDIIGTPGIADSAVAGDTATYLRYGDSSWEELAASASVVLPGGSSLAPAPAANGSPASCIASPSNWGDAVRRVPAGACESHFPVIHVAGDLSLTGGSGQGVLLVDGDLRVTGPITFHGPVIVRGSLSVTGAGAALLGSVMVASSGGAPSVVQGGASIISSSCAVATALRGATRPGAVRLRAWADLF